MEKLNKTRQLIIQVSKKVFLDKGYSATTFQMIADEASISKTSINYYYAKKHDISNEIIGEFAGRCRECAEEMFPYSELMKFVLSVVLFYKPVLTQPDARAFFHDLIRRSTTYSSPLTQWQDSYLDLIMDLNLSISPRQLELKKQSIFGAFNELASSCLSSERLMEDDDFIKATLFDMLSILCVPRRLSEPCVKAALTVQARMDPAVAPAF